MHTVQTLPLFQPHLFKYAPSNPTVSLADAHYPMATPALPSGNIVWLCGRFWPDLDNPFGKQSHPIQQY